MADLITDFSLKTMREEGWILFEGISGSKAYGLDHPESDTDIKGVFVLPRAEFFRLQPPTQLSNESNDVVFYELGRFVELLAKNNPNLLEMLALRPEHILISHPLFDRFSPGLFLSKLCKDTFAGYAMSQIRKARGLNKKVLNPMDRERKSLLAFCWVTEGNQSRSLPDWLDQNGVGQEQIGLASVPHMKDLYALFVDRGDQLGFSGVVSGTEANSVSLSSIPKGMVPEGYLFVNHDGYSTYCKDYREYWDWVEKRNEARYLNTLSHGKNYDAKNMMHTFRLLAMAEEILEHGAIQVYRPDRDFLWSIRQGEYEYDELLRMAEVRLNRIELIASRSSLPDRPDVAAIEKVLIEVREEWYAERGFM